MLLTHTVQLCASALCLLVLWSHSLQIRHLEAQITLKKNFMPPKSERERQEPANCIDSIDSLKDELERKSQAMKEDSYNLESRLDDLIEASERSKRSNSDAMDALRKKVGVLQEDFSNFIRNQDILEKRLGLLEEMVTKSKSFPQGSPPPNPSDAKERLHGQIVTVRRVVGSDVKPSGVIEFDEAGLAGALGAKGSFVVMFYAPWCGHCKAMQPAFENAAMVSDIQFARLDGSKHAAVAVRYGVRGFPTLLKFLGGELAGEYGGDRSEASLRTFAQMESTSI
jgi:thiol-disulfide isomerase/thioredoxin